MRRLALLSLATAVLLPLLASLPAHAQTRSWVSGLGDDANPCSRSAPCKTFAGAISRTVAGGEINCLDPGGYGTVTITKSITIDCTGTSGSILATSGAQGIVINTDSQSSLIVRIRSISINGTLTGARGISILGTGTNDNVISIEDCVIDGFTQFGIIDNARVGRLLVKNTSVRNNSGTAVAVASASGSTTVKATLDNVSTFSSAFGFAFGNGAQAVIKNSIASSHLTAGVEADPGATVMITSSVILGNVTGISAGGGSTIHVRDSDISFNTTGVSGTILSHVDNSFLSNGAGGTITPVAGGVTSPQGFQ